ncbi:Transposase [Phytophthora megakarya]|uniref:Transposase n=1 Tax=Phytophthora megakarya TaxID=4795 RepID=A0A225VE01_9STRA|nr:Transposase [Phytophthora megakarya]
MDCTFTRSSFHRAFVKHVIPVLNSWPFPNSIVILDNAKIHLYKELETVVHETGARLLFLPPILPIIEPNRAVFWIAEEMYSTLCKPVFSLYPDEGLAVAMKLCTRRDTKGLLDVFGPCGYDFTELRDDLFSSLSNS